MSNPYRTGESTKVRIGAVADPNPATPPAKVVILDEKSGTVGFFDKIKGYYKGLITLTGTLLLILTQVSAFVNWIPGPLAGYISVGIAILTTVASILKANEIWVDKLPS